MVPTESGKVRPASCMHPVGTRGGVGWMRGPGACPGGDETGRLASGNPDHSSCHQDKHQAPTLPHIRPLSLQDGGGRLPSFPYSVVNIHQDAGIFYHSPIRLSTFIRDGCGKWMVKQLPSPRMLSTATLPPIASIHSLTSARPNPVPARVGVFPAW